MIGHLGGHLFFFWCCSHFQRFYSNQFDFFFHLFGFTASTFGPSDYYLDRTRFVLLGIFFFYHFLFFFCRLPEHLWGVAVIFCSAIFYRLGILGEFYCLFFFGGLPLMYSTLVSHVLFFFFTEFRRFELVRFIGWHRVRLRFIRFFLGFFF